MSATGKDRDTFLSEPGRTFFMTLVGNENGWSDHPHVVVTHVEMDPTVKFLVVFTAESPSWFFFLGWLQITR